MFTMHIPSAPAAAASRFLRHSPCGGRRLTLSRINRFDSRAAAKSARVSACQKMPFPLKQDSPHDALLGLDLGLQGEIVRIRGGRFDEGQIEGVPFGDRLVQALPGAADPAFQHGAVLLLLPGGQDGGLGQVQLPAGFREAQEGAKGLVRDGGVDLPVRVMACLARSRDRCGGQDRAGLGAVAGHAVGAAAVVFQLAVMLAFDVMPVFGFVALPAHRRDVLRVDGALRGRGRQHAGMRLVFVVRGGVAAVAGLARDALRRVRRGGPLDVRLEDDAAAPGLRMTGDASGLG